MALSMKEKEDIRKARAAYMREYRKRPEFKEWQQEYNRRPETRERRRKERDRYWLKKAKEMKKAGVL